MEGDTGTPQYQVPSPPPDQSQQYQVPPQHIPPSDGQQQYQLPPQQPPSMQSYQQDPQQQFQMPPPNGFNQFQMSPQGQSTNQYMYPPGVNESTPMLPGLITPGGSVNGDRSRRGVSNVRKDRICYALIVVFVLLWLIFGGDVKSVQSKESNSLLTNSTVMPSTHPSPQPTVGAKATPTPTPKATPKSNSTPKAAPVTHEKKQHDSTSSPTGKPVSKPTMEPSSRSKSGATSGSADSSAPQSVKTTYGVYQREGKYRVVSSDDGASESDDAPVASGEYVKNVDGNGWHYFAASVPELRETVRMTSPPTGGGAGGADAHVASNLAIEEYLVGMKGMGYIEGFATCNEMNQWYHNFYAGLFNGGDVMPETLAFLEQNYDWTLKQANSNYLISDYWLSVKGVLQQLDGLAEGHSQGCGDLNTVSGPDVLVGEAEAHRGLDAAGPADLEHSTVKHDLSTLTSKSGASIFHLMLVNANGDMFQIEAKYNMEKMYNITHGANTGAKDDDDIAERVHHLLDAGRIGRRGKRVVSPSTGQPDHCSAIIKLTPDNADVTFAHATWDEFQCASPRIVKRYVFPDVKDNSLLSSNLDLYFSSSPGLLSSVDDYYHVYKEAYSSQLVVMETSLDVFDRHLLESIVPSTVLSWMRARISCQMARTAPQWAHYFSTFHSGTYTNQWMVMDLMRFSPGDPPEKDFLIILEEMPGTVRWEDMTANFTRDKYWASFNLPYFDDIGVLSGISEVCRQDATNCYATDPRSRLFAKYQDRVVDIESTQWMIGYNDFEHDLESMGGACNSVACREDLATNASLAYPFGAIDGKVSSVISAKLIRAAETSTKSLPSLSSSKSAPLPKIYAHMGPSEGGDGALPPFCWAPFDDVTEEHHSYPGMRRDRVFSRFGHPECFEYGWQVFPPQA